MKKHILPLGDPIPHNSTTLASLAYENLYETQLKFTFYTKKLGVLEYFTKNSNKNVFYPKIFEKLYKNLSFFEKLLRKTIFNNEFFEKL